MKYFFNSNFKPETEGIHTFVSFINFPKIISSNVSNTKINYYLDGNLLRILYFLKTKKWNTKYHFDRSGIAYQVFSFIEKKDGFVAIIGGKKNEKRKA